MCHSKCHSVDICLLMLTNGIKLAVKGHDTLRPLGIYCRPFANIVHDSEYHKQFSFTALRPQDEAKWGGDTIISNIKLHLIFTILQFACESKSLFIHFSKWIMWVEGP